MGETTSESTPQRRKVRLSASSGFTSDSMDVANFAVRTVSIRFILLSEASSCLHAGSVTEIVSTIRKRKLRRRFLAAMLFIIIDLLTKVFIKIGAKLIS